MELKQLTSDVISSAIKIHKAIGPGCFERIYEELLVYELNNKAYMVERQVLLPIEYEDFTLENAYKVDLLIDRRLAIELKCVEHILPVHFKQLSSYLKLLGLKHGMLLNFKVNQMKEGVHRVFNNFGQLTL